MAVPYVYLPSLLTIFNNKFVWIKNLQHDYLHQEHYNKVDVSETKTEHSKLLFVDEPIGDEETSAENVRRLQESFLIDNFCILLIFEVLSDFTKVVYTTVSAKKIL